MVVRCAKLLQPSFIYIDEAEKVSLQLIVVVGYFLPVHLQKTLCRVLQRQTSH
jgi:hypothetical protein